AIISSEGPGQRYDNPNQAVMERLSEAGAKIFATYRSGDISITFKKDGIVLSPPDSEALAPENYREYKDAA
ncbi:MAG: hypothetical protein LBS91_01115, partial [Clostridiales Family XIII bacterium]|nr:hypothetical protein [Clostridiales Family XIII bacterium]